MRVFRSLLALTFISRPGSLCAIAELQNVHHPARGILKVSDRLNGSDITLTLSTGTPTIIIDHGKNIEGIPSFQVVSTSANTTRVEVKYSENLATLQNSPTSDGPLGLAAAMDTYRVNYFDISQAGVNNNRLIQGGFRYQKFTLLSPGSLVLAEIKVSPTTSVTSIDSLPGFFHCSDEHIERIWQTGARTLQLNEIPAFSIPEFWQTSPEGSLVESQAPQVLFRASAAALMNYVVEFDVKPLKNGFSFSVLANTLNDGVYILCNIANGSISANPGSTESTSNLLAFANLPTNITEDKWYHVRAEVGSTNISIFMQNTMVLQFTQTYSFAGSFGLGAALNHSALFQNLTTTDPSGNMIYSSQLTDQSFLADFLMGTNPLDTTVDGSKRDRIAYTGDLDVATGSTMVSTLGTSYIEGTLDLIGSYQLTPGFFVPTVKIQQEPLAVPINANITGLIGYSFNLLTAVAGFYQYTGNATLAQEWAPRVVRMLDWAHSQTIPINGLLDISNPALGGDWNYYDPPQGGVVTKFNMVYALALQSTLALLSDAGIDTSKYSQRLFDLRQAIDKNLWSEDLGAYHHSESYPNGFGQDSNAMAILAGVTNANHTSAQVLNSLRQLSTPHGPLSFSEALLSDGFQKIISPYASTYHLRAALSVGDVDVARELLTTLWAPMANPNGANYTGCFWEALSEDGGPGLGPITSLCHAWGAGPTGELSTYVLGVSPVLPGFKEWKVSPQTIGLTWAYGGIPTPKGTLMVAWNATETGIYRMELDIPMLTSGIVELPHLNSSVWTMNGEVIIGNGTVAVGQGGKYLFQLCQS